ncbi:MAG: ferrous iron transport protein A [Phycisphaerae bacterium]|nr:ferrous iron transport protein A [Phycisphaerae bacterium]
MTHTTPNEPTGGEGSPPRPPDRGSAVPLAVVATGQEVEFVCARAGRGLQHRLAEMGIRPGVRFTVLGRDHPGPLIISLKNARFVLGRGMVHRIMVRPTSGRTNH